ASDAGYGFICTFADLVARNRVGKAVLTLPDNAHVLPPLELQRDDDLLLTVTAAGRMLLFPVADLPELSKGKGNKIVSIPAAQLASGDDRILWLLAIAPHSSVTLYAGKRKYSLRPEELQKYQASRGCKGTALPRGLQRVDRIEVDAPAGIASAGSSEE
ncbi:DNA topoisomerase IV subunit A, partial [Dickeya dadantii]